MPNTKDFVPVNQIKENLVILNDGSIAMIVQTSAVNFDLLSENEQLAIIGSFAALLNSLSFSIQILIRSKKLDISHYLHSLKRAEAQQTNPLLQLMMQHYRAFVAAIIRDNEVLDKQFFVVLAVSPIELGLIKASELDKNIPKALNILEPRRDHILKQLSRIGLKSDQLDNERLIKLFYDIYNDEDRVTLSDVQANPANQTVQNAQPKSEHIPPQPTLVNPTPKTAQAAPTTPKPAISQEQSPPTVVAQTPAPTPPPPASPPPPPKPSSPPLYSSSNASRKTPFIVEELPDEFNHP